MSRHRSLIVDSGNGGSCSSTCIARPSIKAESITAKRSGSTFWNSPDLIPSRTIPEIVDLIRPSRRIRWAERSASWRERVQTSSQSNHSLSGRSSGSEGGQLASINWTEAGGRPGALFHSLLDSVEELLVAKRQSLGQQGVLRWEVVQDQAQGWRRYARQCRKSWPRTGPVRR